MKHLNKCVAVIFLLTTFAANAQQISYQNTRNGLTVNLSVPEFTVTNFTDKGEEMSEISMAGSFIPNDEGMPNLPRISRFIAVPNGATVSVDYDLASVEVYHNVNIAPALKLTPTTEEPSTEYIRNEKVYGADAMYPATPVEISEVNSLRGVNTVILGITPFQYNPVTKELVAYKNVTVNMTFDGGDGQYGETRLRSRWFEPILQNTLLNYESLPKVDFSKVYDNSKDEEGCEYLIIIPNREDFRPYANMMRDFRNKQGILTKVMTLNEMGCTSTTQIKNFIHNGYSNWDIPLVAVLIMGDHNTNMSLGVPAEVVNHPYSGSCITDNGYSDVTGDLLPEIVVTRMAAETVAQLQVLVSKAIEYESNPCMDGDFYDHPITALGWQDSRWFQICNETIGGYWRNHGKNPVRVNAIYQGNPGSTWSTAQNTSTVVNYFGPNGTQVIPATPAELGGWTGGTAAGVNNAIDAGGFLLLHSDHGYETGWGEPSYSNSNVQQLTNVGKLIYVIDNDCSTGKYNNPTPCFGEAFHRHTYNGQNAGAIGVLCPTEVSYSFVNDVYFWGMFDYFDNSFLPDYGNHPLPNYVGEWLPAFSDVAGKYFLAQSSWPYNSGDKGITYEIYEQHGDAFLRLQTEIPTEMAIEHTTEIMVEVPIIITCEAGALMAFSKGDELLAVIDATGEEQEIYLPAFEVDDTITIVCTKQNRLRYEAQMLAIPADGPYLVGRGWTINDNNGDGKVEYAETVTIDCNIKNVGIEDCTNTTFTLSTSDPYIIIIDGQAEAGTVPAGEIITVENAFTVKAKANIPDNHVANCLITYSNGSATWTSELTIEGVAPNLQFVSFGVEGQLIPGYTVNIVPSVNNVGHAAVYNASATLTTSCPYVTVNTVDPVSIGDIPTDNTTVSASFSITLSEDTPFGIDIESLFTIDADYEFSQDFEFAPYVDICNVAITLFPYNEGYEENEIPQCWQQEYVEGDSLHLWTVQDGGYQHHPYHAHSGNANAFINGTDITTKLITPTIDLSNASSATLKFWHAQSVLTSNQDILRVYYKNATDGDWQLLATYQFSIANWKERTIELPELTANYTIAFEAECNGGYGIVLDDIEVSIVPSSSLAGDANGDGVVNVQDIMTIVAYLMNGQPDAFFFNLADINSDGIVNILDIMGIVSVIM